MALLAALASRTVRAETAGSTEAWLEAGLDHELPLDFDVRLGAQLELDERLTRVRSVLPQLEVGYRAARWLKLSGGYRFIHERDPHGDFELGHRVFLDGQTSVKSSGVRFKYRMRFQDEWEWSRNGELQNRPTLRSLAGLSYKMATWLRPALSVEHFLALERLDEHPTRKWRGTAGAQVEHGEAELEVFYRLEVEDDGALTNLTHIIGLSFFAEPWSE